MGSLRTYTFLMGIQNAETELPRRAQVESSYIYQKKVPQLNPNETFNPNPRPPSWKTKRKHQMEKLTFMGPYLNNILEANEIKNG